MSEVKAPKVKAPKEYVHTPGTTHLNAYQGAVEEAKLNLVKAQSELAAAETALESKLNEGGE